MAATNYVTKIYNVTRGGEDVQNLQSTSADGSTSAISVIGPVWYSVAGTFGGAQVVAQGRFSSTGPYQDIQGTTASAPVDKRIDFPANARNTLLCVVSNASTTTDLSIKIQAGSGRDIYD